MSIFDKIKHAFQPVEKAVQGFDAHHIAETLTHAIEDPIRKRLPHHLSLGEAVDILKIAEPSSIDIDVAAGWRSDCARKARLMRGSPR